MRFNSRTELVAEQRQDRHDGYGPVCAICGRYTFFGGTNAVPRIPIEQGGTRKAENCIILCTNCFRAIDQDRVKPIPYSDLPFYKV